MIAKDLKLLLSEKSDIVLIDLLPPEHFAKVHIPNAKNACVFFVSFLDDLAAVVPDKQTSVVVYGSSIRSQDVAMALEKLDRAGYQQVSFLKGGLEAWRGAGYDIEGELINQQDDPQTTVTLPDGQYTVEGSRPAGRCGNRISQYLRKRQDSGRI